MIGSGTTDMVADEDVRSVQAGDAIVTKHLKYVVAVKTPVTYEAVVAPLPSLTFV
jgi:hypothetical protein